MSTAGNIFASRAFSLFYAGQAFSYIGYGLRLIALPLLVYHLTNSASALGVTYALELLPFTLFGPLAGSLADRLDRRRLMIVADGIRCSIFVLFSIGYATRTLGLFELYAGIVVESACAAAFVSCQSSSIPYLLGKARATQAISALLATEQAATTVLPPLGAAPARPRAGIFSLGCPPVPPARPSRRRCPTSSRARSSTPSPTTTPTPRPSSWTPSFAPSTPGA